VRSERLNPDHSSAAVHLDRQQLEEQHAHMAGSCWGQGRDGELKHISSQQENDLVMSDLYTST